MIAQVRKIAEQYDFDEIEKAIESQLVNRTNPIFTEGSEIDILNTLGKAGVVRSLVDQGYTMQEAIRELGKRIRELTGG